MSPAHIMVGAVPYGLAAASEMSRSPVPSPSTPEHSRLYGSAAGTPHSPPGPRQTVSISTPEPLVRTACTIVAPSTHTQTHTQISLNFNIFSLHSDTWPFCYQAECHNTAWHESECSICFVVCASPHFTHRDAVCVLQRFNLSNLQVVKWGLMLLSAKPNTVCQRCSSQTEWF